MLGERAQRAAQEIAAGGEAHLDGVAFEPFVERVAVEGSCALVEQIRHHVGDAGFFRRILVGAAAEGEIDGDERRRGLAHQPGFDAGRAHHALDRHRGRRRSRGTEQERDRERRQGGEPHRCAGQDVHERSSRFAASLTR